MFSMFYCDMLYMLMWFDIILGFHFIQIKNVPTFPEFGFVSVFQYA